MLTEDGKLVVQRFWHEVVNQGRLELIDEIFASDCVFHDPLAKGKGLRTIKYLVEMIRTAFPDVQVTIETQMAAEGGRVITQWTGRGTHTGWVDDVEPTGEAVEVPGTSISHVSGGYIQEVWLVVEPLERMSEDEVASSEDEFAVSMFCRYFPRLC